MDTEEKKYLPSREEVKAILKETITIKERKKIVDLMGSYNRIVAEDIVSSRTLPNCPTYKEDGIAIKYSDIEYLKEKDILVEGEDFVFSSQGLPLKDGFDTLVPEQDIEVHNNKVKILNYPNKKGANIYQIGDILQKGEIIVPKYTIIDGHIMGLLAMGGIEGVTVFNRPKIVFIPTGDELINWQETEIEKGLTIESNSVMVYGFAEKYRCRLEIMPIIPDDEDSLEDALYYAKEIADLVIISAGSSKGKNDITQKILKEEGTIILEEVGCDPGRYLRVTKLKDKPILSLPGSPKGVELTLGFYLPTIINKYYHQEEKVVNTLDIVADFSYKASNELDACLEVLIKKEDDKYLGRLIYGRNLVKGEDINKLRGLYYLKRGEEVNKGDKLLVELRS